MDNVVQHNVTMKKLLGHAHKSQHIKLIFLVLLKYNFIVYQRVLTSHMQAVYIFWGGSNIYPSLSRTI